MIEGLFSRKVVRTITGNRDDSEATSTFKAICRDMSSVLKTNSIDGCYERVKEVMAFMRKESLSITDYANKILQEARAALSSGKISPESMPYTLAHYKAAREMALSAGSKFSKRSNLSSYRRL
ncbi:MAG: hypothetical protein KGH59_05020 [Candidatus Micrarchaeota archaeon]|nr:hypothetical protein [Candidatus Micrarchaeota archaeon]